MFYYDPICGDEWYVIEKMPNGMHKAVCTRETKVYPLGTVNYFGFDLSEGVWRMGKFRPRSRTLTRVPQQGKQR